jgi:CBS domain containing-hemolysin-like protein
VVAADPLTASLRLLAALFLVALNGFFVASEFALVRVRSTSVDQMVAEGKPGAETLQAALGNLDDYLAATQLGITVASLGLGWIGEPAVAALIEPVLGELLPAGTVHIVAVAIGFSVVTFLHVVFGELAPKTLSIADAERVATLVAPPMKLFYYLFYPGLVVFNGAANAFTSAIGIPPASETEETLSEEEIRMVLARSGEKGMVDTNEVEMIERVFHLDDVTARDVMVPLPNVATVAADAPLAEFRTTVTEGGHTRYPVVEDGEPVGYVDVKDVLRGIEDGADPDRTAADLAREMPIVPETARVDELLEEFQSSERQMAAVIDEWGELEGIATVEDVVEVVVGDLRDDFDVEKDEQSLRTREDGSHVADGSLSVSAINTEIASDFEATAYGSIGGLVLSELGGAPEAGEEVTVDGYALTVDAVDGARVETVVVREPDPDGDGAGPSGDEDEGAGDDAV